MQLAGPYVVYPTQAWQVGSPGVEAPYILNTSLQGGAWLNNTLYFFPISPQNFGGPTIMCQNIFFSDASDSGWTFLLQDTPNPFYDANNNPFLSQAAPVATVMNDTIFLFFAEKVGGNRLFMSQFNGQSWAPIQVIFDDQFIMTGDSPGVGVYGDQIILVWPGLGANGFFYCTGTVDQSSFPYSISWGQPNVIQGTQSLVRAESSTSYGSALKKQQISIATLTVGDTTAAFFLVLQYMIGNVNSRIGCMIFDLNTQAFTTNALINIGMLNSVYASSRCMATTLNLGESQVPVLVDDVGNISYFDTGSPSSNFGSYGTLAPWFQCGIGSSQGSGIGVGVGIPPSISISGNIDMGPTPSLGAATIVPGTSGGALVCSQWNAAAFSSHSIGFAAVAINLKEN